MKIRNFTSLISAAAIAAAVLFVPAPSAGQNKTKAAAKAATPAAKADIYKAPRTPDGKADLQGIWQASSTGTAFSVEAHTPSLGMQGGVGVVVDPADGKIPYKPEARAKQLENFKNRGMDPMNKCFMPGVPRVTYLPFPFQILQTPDKIVVLSEYAHTTRNIFMKGPHLDGLELWMGDSRGKWEGDTLVVDVNNLNADTWLDQAGNHHSADLHVVEKFTRTGADTMTYEATLEDPKTYTRPWTMRLLLYRHLEPNVRLLEYDCNAYMEEEGSK